MFVLTIDNKVLDTSRITNKSEYFSVLSFKDYKNPDFYFEKIEFLEEFMSASVLLEIGPFKTVVPLPWSILCSDLEYIQAIPLVEIPPGNNAFCLNPLTGYMPEYLPIRMRDIYTNTTWNCPPINEKDMILVPLELSDTTLNIDTSFSLCAIFSPTKIEVSRPISDIW